MRRLATITCALGAACILSGAAQAQETTGGPLLTPPGEQRNTSTGQERSRDAPSAGDPRMQPAVDPAPAARNQGLQNALPPSNLSPIGLGRNQLTIEGSSGDLAPVPGIPQAPRDRVISGSGPPVVVGGPVSSSEAERIASWYRLYIGREITDGELQQILSDRAQGVPLEAVLASILGSREWYQRAGHSPRSWILETLGTLGGPSPLDLRSWLLGLRDSGGDRVAMARVMIERFGMPDLRPQTARVPDVYLQRPVAPGYARSAPPAPLYPPPPIHQHGPYHDDDFYDDDFRYGDLRYGGLNPLSSLLFEAVFDGDRHDHDHHRHLRSHRDHVDRDHDHHAQRHHVQQERIQRHRIQERVQNRIQRQRSQQSRIQQQRAQQRRIQQQRARRHQAHQHRAAGHHHPPHRARGGHPHAKRRHGDDDDREDAIRKRRRQRQKQQRQRQRQRHRHHDHDD